MPYKRLVVKNTLTNYLLVFLRLLEGILLTRWLYHSLGKEYYGFWALLWAIFVYALLFDFGFSKVAQKYTAQRLFETSPQSYNRIISAVFGMHAIMSILIVAGTFVAEHYLTELTGLTDPAELDYCRLCLRLFGIGTALTFPLGMFAEILTGLQKLYLRNYAQIVLRVVELIGIWILLFCGGRLLTLVIYCVSLNFAANFAMAVMAHREIPTLKLRPRKLISTLKRLTNFSFFIYLISIANLIISKADRLILSIFTGLADVGSYQLGSRLPEIVQTMTTQYQENISPITAALHRKGDEAILRDVIFNALRFATLLVTPITIFSFLLTPEILQVLFAVRDPVVTEVCRWLLASTYVFVAFRSVANRFFMMSGSHRLLAGIQISEAVIKLTLCLILVKLYGVLGVLLGSLIPNLALAIFVVVPYLCLFLKSGILRMFFRIYILPLLIVIPGVLLLLLLRHYHPSFTFHFWGLAAAGSAAMGTFLLLCWFYALTKEEQLLLTNKISAKLHRN